jgi:hypothetical protein
VEKLVERRVELCWVWSGSVSLGLWVWVSGCGSPDLGLWVWVSGFGSLGLGLWVRPELCFRVCGSLSGSTCLWCREGFHRTLNIELLSKDAHFEEPQGEQCFENKTHKLTLPRNLVCGVARNLKATHSPPLD